GIEFSDGLFEIEVGAHLVRHQANIGKNERAGETVFGRAGENAPLQGVSACSGRAGRAGRTIVNAVALLREIARKSRRAVLVARPTSPRADAGRAPGSSAAPPRH